MASVGAGLCLVACLNLEVAACMFVVQCIEGILGKNLAISSMELNFMAPACRS